MFEKTQKAANELGTAVTTDATNAMAAAKAAIIPAVSGFFSKIASAAQGVAAGVEDGSIFRSVDPNVDAKSDDGGTFADPLPTFEQNAAIAALRGLGKNDDEIAATVGVSVRTVKMAWTGEA